MRAGLLAVMAVAAIALMLAYLVLALEWRSRPFLGVTVTHTMTVAAGNSATGGTWAGREAGLDTGDLILSIDGQAVVGPESRYYGEVLGGLRAGDEVTVVFSRAGDAPGLTPHTGAICAQGLAGAGCYEVTYPLTRLPDGDFLAFFLIPFASGILVLMTGLVVLRLRAWEPMAFVVVALCFLLATHMAGIFDLGSTHRLSAVWMGSGMLLAGILVTLGLAFPTPINAFYKLPWLRFAPLAASAALAAFVISRYYAETPAQNGFSAQVTGLALIVGLVTLAALLFFYQRPRAVDVVTRDQANTVFIGVSLAMAPALVWLLSVIFNALGGRTNLTFSIEATMPFFITPAFSLAYAVLQYRRFDTDRVISRAIAYSIMLVALIAGYFLLVAGASLFTTDAIQASDPLLVALAIFVISVLFIPVRTQLQRRIDAIYYRTRRNYQDRLESFARRLPSLVDTESIIKAFRALLDDTIQPSSAFIFLVNREDGKYHAYGSPEPETDIQFTGDSGAVTLLKRGDATIYLEASRPWPPELRVDRARLTILQTRILAGLGSGDTMYGMISIGPPRSGADMYNYEELRFINNLIGQISVAIERSQVINSLERRVTELSVLSQVGQAVNFAIEFDDLLELISAQIDKLIPSPYFYIVLHEPATNQLHFAFFLEDDERDREKENKRWAMGNDLFSEVIEKSHLIRVTDYARTMAQHNYQNSFENPNIKAWMAVPLVAGPRTLGVMAIGDSHPTRAYNEDQVRIFTDIGALASTSLDKARLFTETNIRARQLEVLNNISQQLVAAEADVEQLLELITSSAVDILNAEAGSLLLTSEDGSGDLEFKAAVGGTGHELLGTRLPAGFGLVGEVAQSGLPVISNDTSKDERWEGEVAKEGFRTNSVLAVPLIAKNNTVGVLEVLNKLDGTVYVEEDVNLLTTFASQAAVALDNARLLRSTDEQLARRVQELESLERLDRELNTTLDLNKVAEITVRWAITNSGAMAGLLGIPDESETRLIILSSYGYSAEELNTFLEDGTWPMNRGIVRRVARTRQPDLAPDVSIDPDYTPTLTNSLSQITVPMISGDELNAILILEKNQEPRLSLLDLYPVQRLAEHAAIAIANARLYAELTRANESKSEFVAFAAHELKNPLASIKGYADLIRSGMTGDISGQQRDFLGIIRSNADRMQNIIDDLRDVAARDANKLQVDLEPINFRSVVIDTLIPFQNQLEEKEQVIINLVGENLPLVMGDHKRLLQVMTNFVSNAHKYSPPGATITIGAEIIERYISRRNKAMGTVLHAWVQDTGIGLSKEDMNRIFQEDYFRSDNELAREQKGTGLGMMITKSLIDSHNGEVWVESELGKGSAFHFVIPLAVEESRQTEPASD